MLQLALALHKSIEEIEQLSARELAEWMAYHRVRRLPDSWREAGLAAAASINAMGGNVSPDELLPWSDGQVDDQSPDEAYHRFQVLAAGINARVNHERRIGDGTPEG